MAYKTITLPGAVGPSNVLSSVNADAENSIDLYVESTKPGLGKVQFFLRKRAGMRSRWAIGSTGVKCLFNQDGRTFAVAGTVFAELFFTAPDTYTATIWGSVATDPFAPTICSNGSAGNQLFITSGLNGYIFDLTLNSLTLIADVNFPNGYALCGEFMDGYFIVSVINTRRFQISALEDGTSWDGLDQAERSIGSDQITGIKRSGRTLVVFGSLTSEVWYDTGDASFPFAPIQGVFLEVGCSAFATIVRLDNSAAGDSLFWLGQSARGGGVVYRLNGYTPEEVSTPAISRQIQELPAFNDFAELRYTTAWGIQEQSHIFYALALADTTTPTYDLTTQLWHQRSEWNTTTCEREAWLVQCGCFAWGKHLVGDRRTGAIYELSTQFQSDGDV